VSKIVFITQVVDPSDPNLGATRAKIAALARRVDEVVVLCDRGSAEALPANCRVRTFGAPQRSRRAYRFLTAIADVLPLTHYTKLTRDVMLRNEHFWSDGGAIAVVALWGAIGVVGAVRGFRWQPRES